MGRFISPLFIGIHILKCPFDATQLVTQLSCAVVSHTRVTLKTINLQHNKQFNVRLVQYSFTHSYASSILHGVVMPSKCFSVMFLVRGVCHFFFPSIKYFNKCRHLCNESINFLYSFTCFEPLMAITMWCPT